MVVRGVKFASQAAEKGVLTICIKGDVRPMKLSILIPVYNERDLFETFWTEFKKAPLDKCKGITSAEVILVDDGSTDGTRELLKELAKKNFTFACGTPAKITLLLQPHNQGKGAAIRRAIDASKGDVVVIQDADLEYSTTDYPQLFDPIVRDLADAVFGSRFVGSARRVLYFWHSLVNRFITTLQNVLLDACFTDIETGYKAFRGDMLRQWRLTSDRFGIEPELAARCFQAEARVYEVPIQYWGRTYAEGKKIGWKDGVASIYHIINYSVFDKKPYKSGLRQTLHVLDGETHRIYAPAVKRAFRTIGDQKNRRILEIGAGIGALTGELREFGEVVASDISKEFIYHLSHRFSRRKGVEPRIWDATQKWQGKESFDCIVAFNVLEHIEKDKQALENWSNLLRSNGNLVLLVPNLPGLYSSVDKSVGHFRRYNKTTLHAILESVGFEVTTTFYQNALGILGWLVTSKMAGQTALPLWQIRFYAALKKFIFPLERLIETKTGLSLIVVARKRAIEKMPSRRAA